MSVSYCNLFRRAKKRKNYNRMVNGVRGNKTPLINTAKKIGMKRDIIGSVLLDVPKSWWIQQEKKNYRFFTFPTKKKLGPHYKLKQFHIPNVTEKDKMNEKILYNKKSPFAYLIIRNATIIHLDVQGHPTSLLNKPKEYLVLLLELSEEFHTFLRE